MLALLGYALIANYLAPYLFFALWLPDTYVIVLLEDRESRDRFGEGEVERIRLSGRPIYMRAR